MCWSVKVSLAFGLVHLLTSYIAYQRGRISYVLFTAFYAIMELFQASQWIFGGLLLPSEFGHVNCPKINQAFTIGAYFLIWIQPILFGVIGIIESKRRLRTGHGTEFTNNAIVLARFMTITLQSLAVCSWAMFTLISGLFESPSYTIPNSNYGFSTCSEIGPHGHIGWRFAPLTIKYQPTEFVYMLLIFSSLASYERTHQITLGLGWFLTLVYSASLVGFSVDLPAYWCLLSVFVDPLILLDLFTSD